MMTITIETWNETTQQYESETVEYEATSFNTPQHEDLSDAEVIV